jgi:hypothetical protein
MGKDSLMKSSLTSRCVRLLQSWAQASEQYWVDVPAVDGLPVGFYGTGYNQWGVQTNQKYLAAMAMLGQAAKDDHATGRALAALRFSLRTHISAQHDGDGMPCMDGSRWGQTWISSLGVERMMFAVRALEPHMTESDRAALRRMLVSEATWQHDSHGRGKHVGIHANKWNASAENHPESNIWTGCLLWRTAMMYPDHPQAEAWRTKAETFLFNGVSVDSDQGHPLYVGSNFFSNYALDHHGYHNVGYKVICTSNAALLHFDLKAAGLQRPEHLDHHQRDLWQVIRSMIFDDGRLARIGGDSRLRYTYCQEYLLPALLYAADHLGDPKALELVDAQIRLIETEHRHTDDGSFYGRRLQELADQQPYYYTRLESDRACVLGSVIAYLPLVNEQARQTLEQPATIAWIEPEYGSAMHRSEKRLASWAWRANGYTQGLCLPPSRGDLAEWSCNLAGLVQFVGDSGTFASGQTPHRELGPYTIENIPGGFITCGQMIEGMNLVIPEGLKLSSMAVHHLCFAALPDGQSVVGLQLLRMNNMRAHLRQIKGLHLNIPNDLYNHEVRTLTTQQGEEVYTSLVDRRELIDLHSRWACVDHAIGVIGLYGAKSLMLDRSPERRGGYYRSLYIDELCWHARLDTHVGMPGQVLMDAGWRVIASADAKLTRQLAEADASLNADIIDSAQQGMMRSVAVLGSDGVRYRVTADFAQNRATVTALDA